MTARQAFADVAAVGGVGMTELSKNSGRTVRELAVEACRQALDDAGLEASRIGAMLSYHYNDSAPVNAVAQDLGVPDAAWTNEIFGGGTQSASILGDAAMLIEGGVGDAVLVFRALNGRSGVRMGQVRGTASGERQFTDPYGYLGPVQAFALSSQRWMHDTGAEAEDLMAVVLQSRFLARANPRALLSDDLDERGYLASPFVATPLRRADCCLESDGAVAVVVARVELLDATRPGSPRIRAALRGGGPGAGWPDRAASVSTLYSHYLAPKLYQTAGIRPADIGLALIYDAYSPIVLQQLEDWGFAPRGESGALVRSGATLPGGRLPVNPHGGLLSEGYVHGFNNVAEAVRQLRGEATGHQVPIPELALCTGFGGSYGSALLLAAA